MYSLDVIWNTSSNGLPLLLIAPLGSGKTGSLPRKLATRTSRVTVVVANDLAARVATGRLANTVANLEYITASDALYNWPRGTAVAPLIIFDEIGLGTLAQRAALLYVTHNKPADGRLLLTSSDLNGTTLAWLPAPIRNSALKWSLIAAVSPPITTTESNANFNAIVPRMVKQIIDYHRKLGNLKSEIAAFVPTLDLAQRAVAEGTPKSGRHPIEWVIVTNDIEDISALIAPSGTPAGRRVTLFTTALPWDFSSSHDVTVVIDSLWEVVSCGLGRPESRLVSAARLAARSQLVAAAPNGQVVLLGDAVTVAGLAAASPTTDWLCESDLADVAIWLLEVGQESILVELLTGWSEYKNSWIRLGLLDGGGHPTATGTLWSQTGLAARVWSWLAAWLASSWPAFPGVAVAGLLQVGGPLFKVRRDSNVATWKANLQPLGLPTNDDLSGALTLWNDLLGELEDMNFFDRDQVTTWCARYYIDPETMIAWLNAVNSLVSSLTEHGYQITVGAFTPGTVTRVARQFLVASYGDLIANYEAGRYYIGDIAYETNLYRPGTEMPAQIYVLASHTFYTRRVINLMLSTSETAGPAETPEYFEVAEMARLFTAIMV